MINWLANIVKSFLTTLGVFFLGREVQAQENRADDAEARAEAYKKRLEIENEIQGDIHLVDRAISSGLVRKDD
jgi:hypothetical protein